MATLHEQLAAPFRPEDLDWRVQRAGQKNGRTWALVVPYVTARAVQDRLDEVFGVLGWQFEVRPHPRGGLIGTLSVRDPETGDWILKEDVGGDIESGGGLSTGDALKGEASTAQRRVAVQLGVGRYLYGLDAMFANIHDDGSLRGQYKDGDTRHHFRYDPPRLPAEALPDGYSYSGPNTQPENSRPSQGDSGGSSPDPDLDLDALKLAIGKVDDIPLNEDGEKALAKARRIVAGELQADQARVDLAAGYLDALAEEHARKERAEAEAAGASGG